MSDAGPLATPLGFGREAEGPGYARCSARGCRAAARWVLRWNNPAVHTPERRKGWAACDVHRDHLASFLRSRGFLRDIEPVAVGASGQRRGPDDPGRREAPAGPGTSEA